MELTKSTTIPDNDKEMLTEKTLEKLRILAESAKYDVSCSSSGTVRGGKQGMVGNTVGGVGICHSFADDGRCISLLKVMLTNYCMYDCESSQQRHQACHLGCA